MEFPFPVLEMTEGTARLLVPNVPRRKGPGTAGPWPFYNPTMAVNRDMSSIVLEQWPARLGATLDGLAATGAWGIRMALEAGVRDLTLTDRSSVATDLAQTNVRRNGIDAVVATEDLTTHLETNRYDFVDIDPFGPPTPFLEAAFESARPGSGLGITATDTAVLSGTYPETCRRRYGARSLRCDQGAEIGVRILLGYCARLASHYGKVIDPMVSFAAAHFVRLVVRLRSSRQPPPVGWLARAPSGEFRFPLESARGAIGPAWTTSLQDADFVSRLTPSRWTQGSTLRLLATIQEEADLPPFFVTTDELAMRERGSPPKLDRFLEGLREIGYRAARTHFHPRGVRTTAPYADVVRVFRERIPTGSTDGSGPAS
ncbi:MAG: methyltransferase [Thermoplasmata archaeon]